MSVQWLGRTALDRLIATHVSKVDVVLDIGCGIRPQTFFRPKVHICCEPYEEYIRILRNGSIGNPSLVIIQATWQEALKLMPQESVDSVFLLDLIEHLDKNDGLSLLSECTRIARKQIILFTPLGFMPQEYEQGEEDGWGLHGGDWQRHRSGWMPDDFDASWTILAARRYHTINGKGEPFEPPFGAFWAIKNLELPNRRRWFGVRHAGHWLVDAGCDKADAAATLIRRRFDGTVHGSSTKEV